MSSVWQSDTSPNEAVSPRGVMVWLTAFGVVLLWSFWPSFVTLVQRWSQDSQYTHGYVVPLFAALVLWLRRDRFPGFSSRGAWPGLLLLVFAGSARVAGAVFAFDWLEIGAFLPALAGVVWLACGSRVALWAWPVGALLMFVLPWPWQIDQLLTHPLRHLATVCSTFALQTLGVPALARGNIIVIDEMQIGIVEACSGLGMLMTFFALSTAVAFAIDRPILDKWIVFLSAVPIALVMNVFRITLTVLLFQFAGSEVAKVVFHDVAGWVMMPMALVAVWLLLRLWDAAWESPQLRFWGKSKSYPLPQSSAAPQPARETTTMMQEISDAAP